MVLSAVPDSYTGPRMVDGNITPEFVAALVEEFKAQRLVHKRYVVEMLVKLKPIFASTPSLVTVGVCSTGPTVCCRHADLDVCASWMRVRR